MRFEEKGGWIKLLSWLMELGKCIKCKKSNISHGGENIILLKYWLVQLRLRLSLEIWSVDTWIQNTIGHQRDKIRSKYLLLWWSYKMPFLVPIWCVAEVWYIYASYPRTIPTSSWASWTVRFLRHEMEKNSERTRPSPKISSLEKR